MPAEYEDEVVGDDEHRFFRTVCGRRLNCLSPHYMLPADEEEMRRLAYQHRMVQFVFEGKNYVGPVEEVLASVRGRKPRIMDLGCGSGIWACEIADEFPSAEVIGVDIAPVQPLEVPPNCDFEICDLDCVDLPYPSEQFDVIHARCISSAIRNYPEFLREVTRMLRPGGLLLLVEIDHQPVVDGRRAPFWQGMGGDSVLAASGAPGWFAVWDAYLRAVQALGIDVSVPRRLGTLIWNTGAYDLSKTFGQEADIPVGFYHRDPTLLTVGQLAWMDFDLLLNSLRPYLYSIHIPSWQVERMIEDAQTDLYYPVMRLTTRLHVVRGIKM